MRETFSPTGGRRQVTIFGIRLETVEIVGVMVGTVIGFIAAAPHIWLSGFARKVADPALAPAAEFMPTDLLLLWLCGVVFGGFLAIRTTRVLLPGSNSQLSAAVPTRLRSVGRFIIGLALVAVFAPLPGAVIIGLLVGGMAAVPGFYVVGGSLVGWESGVIAFVFIYTFKRLESMRITKEETP